MTNVSGPVDNVLQRLRGVSKTGESQWMARCPCRNDDEHPSLAVSQGDDGEALLYCHRGASCSVDEICKTIGLTPKDLFNKEDVWVSGDKFSSSVPLPTGAAKKKLGKKIEKTYKYVDEEGNLLYEKVRYRFDDGSKSFANRQPDKSRPGEYIWTLREPEVRRVLYNLPDVIAAIKGGEPVWLVEGEKDADTLSSMGITATTMDSGAGKWDQSYTDTLSSAHVEIIADNDEVGKIHALNVSEKLLAAGARGCTIWVSKYGKDITDHLTSGRSLDELSILDPYQLPEDTHEAIEEVEESREDSLLDQIAEVFAKDKLTLAQKLNRASVLVSAAQFSEPEMSTGRLVVWQEFIQEADDDSYEWVIPGLIEKSERVMVVAAEGVGKTMLARQVALCSAAGLHPFTFQKMEPVRTLTIDLENPERIIRRTSRKIMQEALRKSGARHVDAHLLINPSGLDLTSPRDRMYIENIIERVQPQLICLGPMYKSFVDNGSRTSEALAVEVAKYLDMIRDVYGCALWLEHHAPLGNSMSTRDLRPFGSSVWSRWPEFGLALTPDPTNPAGYVYDVGHFRGARDKRPWPLKLARGSDMPFVVLEYTKVD